MAINRKKFLGLALSMWIGPAGCGGGAKKSESTVPTSRSIEGVNGRTGPAVESGFADEGSNLSPGDERYLAPGDEGGAMMPANECTSWDPSGECTGWGGMPRPADECVDWDPSGECIRWE